MSESHYSKTRRTKDSKTNLYQVRKILMNDNNSNNDEPDNSNYDSNNDGQNINKNKCLTLQFIHSF